MAPKLSSGTLNLKFMQRGQPPRPSGPASTSPVKKAKDEWDTVPKRKGKERASEVGRSAAVEDGAAGFPRAKRNRQSPRASVVYEASYAAFPILSTRYADTGNVNEAGPSSLPLHAGRRSFGQFNADVERLGQAPIPILPERAGSDSDSDNDLKRKAPKVNVRGSAKSAPKASRPKPAPAKQESLSPAKPVVNPPTTSAANGTGFRRPAGFDQVKPSMPSSSKPIKRSRPADAEDAKAKKMRQRAVDLDSEEDASSGSGGSSAEVAAAMTGVRRP